MPGEALRHPTLLDDAVSEASFGVQATGPVDRARQSLKHNDTFLVLDSHGDIGVATDGRDGLFHCDTRFLSRLELLVDGMPALPLGSSLSDDNFLLTVDLSNPDIEADGHIVLQKDVVHIVRSLFVWRNTAYQRIGFRNHGNMPVLLDVAVRFDCDFSDLFEVRGTHRKKRGSLECTRISATDVRYSYRGLDNSVRRTMLHLYPQPVSLSTHKASYRLDLSPGESFSLFVTACCDSNSGVSHLSFARALISARREIRALKADAPMIMTGHETFNEMLARSRADLNILTTQTPEGPYPYAGIPWFSTTFGRDGIITALQLMWLAPNIARGVLRRLAAYQARVDDPTIDAQPGKILHEMRGGEMAALREVPFGLYYGSVDATPLYVLLAGLYFERTGDIETIKDLWPSIEAALAWIDGAGDIDGDGFVEYRRLSADGLANQGWKDSLDAIFHADGRLAEGNIALVEVQAYVYAAKRLAAVCARSVGASDRARRLEADLESLAQKFESAFWCDEIGTYAIALDGAKSPCRVRASNAGQILFSGMVSEKRACAVASTLMEPSSFSGWGIRTIAKGEARFNPMSYHNGSIWPHDNAMIALGFARYGLKEEAIRLFDGMFAAATHMDLRRLPELFCGFQRQRHRGPTLYPVACAPQAWASAVPFGLLSACLGFEFDPQKSSIRLRNPRLPAFLNDVAIKGLRVGDSEADLRLWRCPDHTLAFEIVRARGDITVSVVP